MKPYWTKNNLVIQVLGRGRIEEGKQDRKVWKNGSGIQLGKPMLRWSQIKAFWMQIYVYQYGISWFRRGWAFLHGECSWGGFLQRQNLMQRGIQVDGGNLAWRDVCRPFVSTMYCLAYVVSPQQLCSMAWKPQKTHFLINSSVMGRGHTSKSYGLRCFSLRVVKIINFFSWLKKFNQRQKGTKNKRNQKQKGRQPKTKGEKCTSVNNWTSALNHNSSYSYY